MNEKWKQNPQQNIFGSFRMWRFISPAGLCGKKHGCAGEKDCCRGKKNSAEGEAMVYIPEWLQPDLQCEDGSYLGALTLAGDNLYYSYHVTTPDGKVDESYIGRIDLLTGEGSVPQKQGDGEIKTLFTDPGQNLWCLRIVSEGTEGQRKWLFERGFPGESSFMQIDVTKHLEGTEMLIDFVMDENDNLYCLGGAPGNPMLKVIDGNGDCIRTVEKLYNVNSMDVWEGKGVLLAGYGDNARLFTLQSQNPEILEDIYNRTGILKTAVQEDGTILFVRSGSLIYLEEGEEPNVLVNLIQCNIVADNIEEAGTLSDGRIALLLREFDGQQDRFEMVYLKKVPENEVPEKKSIRLGTLTADTALNTAVATFNKKNPEYELVIVSYNSEDYRSMGLDAATTGGPDIFDLRNVSDRDLEAYLEKGILEDLMPYLDTDITLKPEDFLPGFLESYTRKGVLYTIPDSFRVETLIGKSSEVGEAMAWTPREFMDFAAGQPEGVQIMEYANKQQIFRCVFDRQASFFIDWEKKESNLDCEEFKKLLEFANRYPLDYPVISYDQIPQLLRDGRLKLEMASIGGISDIQVIRRHFGEPITCIGYPSAEGVSGSCFQGSGLMLGINSSSDYKEEAWSFVRMGLEKESQLQKLSKDVFFLEGFPSRRDVLESCLERSMEAQYEKDANGELTEIPKYAVYEFGEGGESFETAYYAATQEEVDTLKELIYSITGSETIGLELQNIILEEAEAYFTGQKGLDETAAVIQNRVQIYLNEKR